MSRFRGTLEGRYEKMMKENKLRRILNEGKGSVSTRIWSPWATMMEAAASTGIFDYLEFVAEYSPYDLMLMENMARACELHDTGSMIKVDFQNRFYVAQKAMAAGFQAILFTDHKTPEEVEESIYMTMPDCPEYKGRFGFPNNRWIGFNGYIPQLDYAKMCADTVRIFMVEKADTMKNIEAICKVKGVDMLQFGPSDFSLNNGWNRSEHMEDCKKAEEDMIRCALENGVQPRCEIHTLEDAERYKELGVKHFSIGDELKIMKTYWETTAKSVKDLRDAMDA